MRQCGALTILACAAILDVANAQSVVYSTDFEGEIGPEWSSTDTDITPTGQRRFLGQFGNDRVTLQLSDLPSHTQVSLSFELFIIGSWDGDYTVHQGRQLNWGPDVWSLVLTRGATLLQTTFNNHHRPAFVGSCQSYPHAYLEGTAQPQEGASETNTLGYAFADAVYRLQLTFGHSSSSLGLQFSASGLEDIDNESWGLDNVQVEFTDEGLRDEPNDLPVFFADPNLKAAVQKALGIDHDPTVKDILELTSLSAGSQGIGDLTGLEYAVNMTSLRLAQNQIGDISPLAGLTNLEELNLWGNSTIRDISVLSNLTNLTSLTLQYNQIEDISTLANLNKLRYLNLYGNQISDISALSGLTLLEELIMGANSVVDISPLAQLANLRVLKTQGNQISDIRPLTGLTGLRDFWLGSGAVTDVAPLRNLTDLEILRIWQPAVCDLSFLENLQKLTYIDIHVCDGTSIGVLADRSGLTYLRLSGGILDASAYAIHIPLIVKNNPDLERDVTLFYEPADVSGTVIFVDNSVSTADGNGRRGGPDEDGSLEHPYLTIQAAIDHPEPFDTIVVMAGTYGGEGNCNIEPKGKAFLLQSLSGAETCTIDCSGQGWAFHIHHGEVESTVIDGLTLSGDSAVLCEGAAVVLKNCKIVGSTQNKLWVDNGTIYLDGQVRVQQTLLGGSGTFDVADAGDVTMDDVTVEAMLTGAGTLRVPPDAGLVIRGNGVVTAADAPSNPGSEILCDGSLMLCDSARLEHKTVYLAPQAILLAWDTAALSENCIHAETTINGIDFGSIEVHDQAMFTDNTVYTQGGLHLGIDPDAFAGTIAGNAIHLTVGDGCELEVTDEPPCGDLGMVLCRPGIHMLNPVPEQSTSNLTLASLTIQAGASVMLVDDEVTSAADNGEALYVKSLVLESGARLDAGSQRLYYETLSGDPGQLIAPHSCGPANHWCQGLDADENGISTLDELAADLPLFPSYVVGALDAPLDYAVTTIALHLPSSHILAGIKGEFGVVSPLIGDENEQLLANTTGHVLIRRVSGSGDTQSLSSNYDISGVHLDRSIPLGKVAYTINSYDVYYRMTPLQLPAGDYTIALVVGGGSTPSGWVGTELHQEALLIQESDVSILPVGNPRGLDGSIESKVYVMTDTELDGTMLNNSTDDLDQNPATMPDFCALNGGELVSSPRILTAQSWSTGASYNVTGFELDVGSPMKLEELATFARFPQGEGNWHLVVHTTDLDTTAEESFFTHPFSSNYGIDDVLFGVSHTAVPAECPDRGENWGYYRLSGDIALSPGHYVLCLYTDTPSVLPFANTGSGNDLVMTPTVQTTWADFFSDTWDPNGRGNVVLDIWGTPIPSVAPPSDSAIEQIVAKEIESEVLNDVPQVEALAPNGDATLSFKAFDLNVDIETGVLSVIEPTEVLTEAQMAQSGRTLRVRYAVELSARKKYIERLIARRNEVTFKKLPPGTYKVRYRVEVVRRERIVAETEYSPPQTFTISK